VSIAVQVDMHIWSSLLPFPPAYRHHDRTVCGRLGECPGETVRETLGARTRQHRPTCHSVNIPLATLSLVLTRGFCKTGDGYQPHLDR